MGKFHNSIKDSHLEFIVKQKMFFVSTAPLDPNGHINLSPKGLDSFRVISENEVAYLDHVGSGNETSAHTLENGRITFMFCSFEGPPNILRLYGKARAVLPNSKDWVQYAGHFDIPPSVRQIFVARIHLVQTSCGFGVPLFQYMGERDQIREWAEKKGKDGLEAYIKEKNLKSLDGLPTDHAVSNLEIESSKKS
jgi:hypothetical protein